MIKKMKIMLRIRKNNLLKLRKKRKEEARKGTRKIKKMMLKNKYRNLKTKE
jgi:hypothetical protein